MSIDVARMSFEPFAALSPFADVPRTLYKPFTNLLQTITHIGQTPAYLRTFQTAFFVQGRVANL